MKSLVRIGLAMALALTFVSRPKQAQASSALSAGIMIYTAYFHKPAENSPKNNNPVYLTWAGLLAGAMMMSAGWFVPFIILDEDSGSLKLTAMDLEDAALLEITESQLKAYNNNVDLLNAIAEEIYFTFGEEGTRDEMKDAWEYYLNAFEVPQDARVAFAKVAEVLAHQMQSM